MTSQARTRDDGAAGPAADAADAADAAECADAAAGLAPHAAAVPALRTSDGGDPRPAPAAVPEIGGRAGPDPTRYGDWEMRGRCIDF